MNRKEFYNPDDILGMDENKNMIAVDIMAPVGESVRTNCATAIGILDRLKDDGTGVYEIFVVGMLCNEKIIASIVTLACETTVEHLGAVSGAEMLALLQEGMKKAIAESIHKEVAEQGASIHDIIMEIDEKMRTVKKMFDDGKISIEEESEDESEE